MTALQAYEVALQITERMLTCARAAHWDELVALEKARGDAMDDIGRCDPDPGRDLTTRARKRTILTRMIVCDEEVAALTQDWMAELRQILTSADTRQKLDRTYRSG